MAKAEKPKSEKVVGRPKVEIDWAVVDACCAIQATAREICAQLNINVDTLTDACKREKGMNFSEYSKEKQQVGILSLRRDVWSKRNKSDRILVHLSEHYLGTGKKTPEVQVNTNVSVAEVKIDDEQMERILKKIEEDV